MNMLRRQGLFLLGIALVTLFALFPFGNGQSAPGESSVSGVVIDDTDTPVHAAMVGVKDAETGATTMVLSGTQGEFKIPQLAEGNHQISTIKAGYRTKTSQLSVSRGSNTLNIRLVSLPAVPMAELSNADFNRFLPEAPGKRTLVELCGYCHGVKTVFSQGGRSREAWAEVIQDMLGRGGYAGSSEWIANQRLEAVDTGPVLDYLSTYYGPDSPLRKQVSERAKQAGNRDELPIGLDVVYKEFDVPTVRSGSHTAAPDWRGNVWISESRVGKIGRLEISTGKFAEYQLKTARPHGITTGPDGIVWAPSPPHVLARFDPKTERLDEFELPEFPGRKDNPPTPNSAIVAKDGKVWITEQDRLGDVLGAVTSFDPVTQEFKRYRLGKLHSPYGIITHGDLIWFTMIRPGKIGFINPETEEIRTFTVPKRSDLSAEDRPGAPRRLRFDAKGQLWFGDWGSHRIGMFDPSSEKFTFYELPYPSSPYSIYVDARPGFKGYVWVGNHDRDSLIRLDPDTKELVEYPLSGVGSQVRDIWPDEEGRLWFTQYGRDKVTRIELIQTK